MSKYAFKPSQRYAVYKAFDGICQWCREPVNYLGFHVDHVLPETLLGNEQEKEEIFKTYGLDDSFNINDYENWAPLHGGCNQLKNNSRWKNIGIIKTILDDCRKRKELEQRIEVKINKDVLKSEFLAKFQAALESHALTIQQLQQLILTTDIMDEKDEELKNLGLQLQQKASYQTDQMINTIILSLNERTRELLIEMAKNLGPDWVMSVSVFPSRSAKNSDHCFKYNLTNKVNEKYTVGFTISPYVENKEIHVSFLDGHQEINHLKYNLIQGVNYTEYFQIVRELHIKEIENKIHNM